MKQPNELSREFAAETNQLVRSRLVYTAATYVVVMFAAWGVEYYAHPGREFVFALTYAAQATILGLTIVAIRTTSLGQHSVTAATVAVCALCALIATYHVIVGGEAEILAMALAYLVTATTVAIPWGVRGQVPVALMAVLAFGAAVASGVHAPISASLALLGLGSIGGLSVMGAYFLERYRWDFFQQAQALAVANEALQEASRAKNSFIAGVSHELRTPLNIITGYTDLLLDNSFGPLTEIQRDPVLRVQRSAAQLLCLISDVIDLSRLELGRLSIQIGEVQLAPLFEEIEGMAETLLRQRPVRFHASVQNGLSVRADSQRLQQILVNLVNNAAKYTERGTIEVRARNENGRVAVEVQDTGLGIPANELEAIFKPFFRGTRRGTATGVGLGLSLSARLVELMGGSILVQSVVGKGSTFTVLLDEVAAEPTPVDAEAEPRLGTENCRAPA